MDRRPSTATTSAHTRESAARRLRRVVAETGGVGLAVRGTGRAMLGLSELLDRTACHWITALPNSWLTRPSDRRRLERNAELAGKHAGERCYILGNGPSLRHETLSPLKDGVLFTVNQGHRFARENALIPTYHAAVDSVFVKPEYDDLLRDWAAFQAETGATLLLSMEIADRYSVLGLAVSSFAVKQFLKSTYFDRIGRSVPTDLRFVQPGYLSVIHFAIVAALYMDFAEICLVGCDMDFFIEPARTFTHSYDSSDDSSSTEELFGWDQVELMQWCLDEFRSFRQLRRLAESRGVRIINAGRDGALNVFAREPLGSVPARQVLHAR